MADQRRIFQSVLLVLFTAGLASFAQSACEPSSVQVHETALVHWLSQAGLGEDLQITKLRRTSHPTAKDDTIQDALQLQLLFLTQSTAQAKEDTRFEEFSQRYQSTYGAAAAERVFYKLVHECEIGPPRAVVIITVLEKDYVFFTRSGNPEIVMQLRANRALRMELSVVTPKFQASGSLKEGMKNKSAPLSEKLSEQIEEFFQNYFLAVNRKSGMPPPTIHFDAPPAPGNLPHVGVFVSGIRGQVTGRDNRWEELEISVDVDSLPNRCVLVLYFEGYSAAGLLGRQPSPESYGDMRREYPNELKHYASDLVRALSNHFPAE